ncbi:hypothetical protein [Streptomyces tirandamycinicus]|uniref:hypothetical protein n=1 Tax=Streptomyces tirandamycinicus TaxID=2174846 RepID=UPI00142D350F|nr:hypothetical protein [Streptomyces tirandamycinicus]
MVNSLNAYGRSAVVDSRHAYGSTTVVNLLDAYGCTAVRPSARVRPHRGTPLPARTTA